MSDPQSLYVSLTAKLSLLCLTTLQLQGMSPLQLHCLCVFYVLRFHFDLIRRRKCNAGVKPSVICSDFVNAGKRFKDHMMACTLVKDLFQYLNGLQNKIEIYLGTMYSA